MNTQRTHKHCRHCDTTKPLTDFYPKHKRPGVRSFCKKCECKRTQSYQRPSRPGGPRPPYNRNGHLMRKYGITQEDFNWMLADQGGACAICWAPQGDRVLHVDHDHATGQVRGLLCSPCNLHLAWVENEDFLNAALAYLGAA